MRVCVCSRLPAVTCSSSATTFKNHACASFTAVAHPHSSRACLLVDARSQDVVVGGHGSVAERARAGQVLLHKAVLVAQVLHHRRGRVAVPAQLVDQLQT